VILFQVVILHPPVWVQVQAKVKVQVLLLNLIQKLMPVLKVGLPVYHFQKLQLQPQLVSRAWLMMPGLKLYELE
jgi:hypothetical protein